MTRENWDTGSHQAIIPIGGGESVSVIFPGKPLTPDQWDLFTNVLMSMRNGVVSVGADTPPDTSDPACTCTHLRRWHAGNGPLSCKWCKCQIFTKATEPAPRPSWMLPDNPPGAMCECGDEASKHQRRSEWCLNCGNCSRFKPAGVVDEPRTSFPSLDIAKAVAKRDARLADDQAKLRVAMDPQDERCGCTHFRLRHLMEGAGSCEAPRCMCGRFETRVNVTTDLRENLEEIWRCGDCGCAKQAHKAHGIQLCNNCDHCRGLVREVKP